MAMGLKRKDLLGIQDLTVEEVGLILDTAISMKEVASRDIKKVPTLRGKTIINLFYEPSTRTRTSFEIAGKWMSADVINISTAGSSVVKGESLKDTGLTLQAMHPDIVVIRHPVAGAPKLLAGYIRASVINAGDGAHEHPTQALLDLFTIREKRGTLQGLKAAIVGDIVHSRVARSNIFAMQKVGMQHTDVNPPRAAARVPVAMVSLSSRPGSRRWTCRSTNPGHTTLPRASSTRSGGAASRAERSGPTAAIRPSSISTSRTASTVFDGSTTRPPSIRILMRPPCAVPGATFDVQGLSTAAP